MRVQFETRKGRVCSFSVVLLVEVAGQLLCATRYDSAHGLPHRDVLGLYSGLIAKHWLTHLTYKQALDYALDDFYRNHETYISYFLAH